MKTDPLTTLLAKYIAPDHRPARDISGAWENEEFDTLVVRTIPSERLLQLQNTRPPPRVGNE